MSHMSRTLRRAAVLALMAVAGCLAAAAMSASAQAATDSCPNAELRTGTAAHLPECRAYEQVSPAFKATEVTLDASNMPGVDPAAPDGSAVMFRSRGAIAGQPWGGNTNPSIYISRRTDGQWRTSSLTPRISPTAANFRIDTSSTDLDTSLFTSGGVLASDLEADLLNVYLLDNPSGSVLGSFGVNRPDESSLILPITTPDLGHVVFASRDVLLGTPGIPASEYSIYEFVDGALRLVSVQDDGTPFQVGTFPAGGNISGAIVNDSSTIGGISDDGRHVFFTTLGFGDPAAGVIYRRSDGETTELATPSQVTPADPLGPQPKSFRKATRDGNRLFFTSAEQLTDDANTGPSREARDLYRYDFAADQLVDISAIDGGPVAEVRGLVDVSDDGGRVYYVANGQVVPGEGTPASPNLYLWEDDGTPDGETRFIATLAEDDVASWTVWRGDKQSRVTPDGEHLLFRSSADIPAHDNGDVAQLYLYDADASGGQGALACVSCNPAGDQPLGASTLPANISTATQSWEFTRTLSSDGRYVFFDSDDALVPSDNNGKTDAYVWSDGQAQLLSSGTSPDDSHFYNASADGADAFFVTREQLVGQDADHLVDLYVAKVGGGLEGQRTVVPPSCDGDGCQPASGGGDRESGVASDTFRGLGDVEDARPLALLVRGLSARQVTRLARGRRVGVKVRVGRRGTVRATARARIGKRPRVVATGSAVATAPGAVTVRLRLRPAARRALRAGRTLVIALRVNAPGAQSRAIAYRLKRPRS
jgi:hypothetical protein